MTIAALIALLTVSCRLDGQRIDSAQRVCFYDCAGRQLTVRISPSKECPVILRPQE